MDTLNTKKFQNTPRNANGIAPMGAKRVRLPQTAFEDDSVPGRSRSLHPTKGWRSRNLEVVRRHGEVVRRLDENRPVRETKQKRIFVNDKVYGRREIRLSSNKYA